MFKQLLEVAKNQKPLINASHNTALSVQAITHSMTTEFVYNHLNINTPMIFDSNSSILNCNKYISNYLLGIPNNNNAEDFYITISNNIYTDNIPFDIKSNIIVCSKSISINKLFILSYDELSKLIDNKPYINIDIHCSRFNDSLDIPNIIKRLAISMASIIAQNKFRKNYNKSEFSILDGYIFSGTIYDKDSPIYKFFEGIINKSFSSDTKNNVALYEQLFLNGDIYSICSDYIDNLPLIFHNNKLFLTQNNASIPKQWWW